MLNRVLARYCKVLDAISALFLLLMVILVFGNVVLRYGFNSGWAVSEEVSRWLFVWMTFLGAIVAMREHQHLGTDMLVTRLPPAGKKICLVASLLLMLYVCWLLFRRQPAADADQLGRDGALQRRLGGHLLRHRRRLRRLGGDLHRARPVAGAVRAARATTSW